MRSLFLVLCFVVLCGFGQEIVEITGLPEVPAYEGEMSRAERFRQADPTGAVMTVTAISVVLLALTMLFLIFWALGQMFRRLTAPRATKKAAAAEPVEVSGDVYAAIAVAIYRYSRDLHDVENTVLTINRAAKVYSPWSSKIYGLRRLPDKR